MASGPVNRLRFPAPSRAGLPRPPAAGQGGVEVDGAQQRVQPLVRVVEEDRVVDGGGAKAILAGKPRKCRERPAICQLQKETLPFPLRQRRGHVGVGREDREPFPAVFAEVRDGIVADRLAPEDRREKRAGPAEACPVHHVGREELASAGLHHGARHGLHPFPAGGKQEPDEAVEAVDVGDPDLGKALFPGKTADLLWRPAAPQQGVVRPEMDVGCLHILYISIVYAILLCNPHRGSSRTPRPCARAGRGRPAPL